MPDPGRSPTAVLPLRWGRHAERIVLGLALISGGAIAVAGSSLLVAWLAALGVLAQAAGWAILPADGWRRIVAASVTAPASLALLAGPRYLGVLVVGYLAWLLVRHRPPRAWFTALIPIAGAVLVGRFAPATGAMASSLAMMALVLVASAWTAALLSGRFEARSGRIRSRGRPADS